MKIDVLADSDSVALAAAAFIAAEAATGVREHGRFVLAVSGGRTARGVLSALADQEIPWHGVHIVQVDERIAAAGHSDRNLTDLRACLLDHVPLRGEQIHAMPVEALDLCAAAASYERELSDIAGSPPVIDLAHLGLGVDGHTASLVPGDPVLEVADTDVAVTGAYESRRRMTLTYPILNRARRIIWIVTGGQKSAALSRLLAGDRSVPAGHVNRRHARIFADGAAAGQGARGEVKVIQP